MKRNTFKWQFKDLFYLIIFILATGFFISSILRLLVKLLNINLPISDIDYIIIPLFIIFWHKFMIKDNFHTLGFTKPLLKYSYLYSVLLAITLFVAISIFYLKNFKYLITYEYSRTFLKQSLLAYTTKLEVISVAFVGPFIEEILFRSIIFQIFLKKFNFFISAILSSILFSLAHIYMGLGFNLYMSIATSVVFGFFAATLFYHSKSIYPSLYAHILLNMLVTSSKVIAKLS